MKVYLEKQYNHRYPMALIGAVVLPAMGLLTLWGLLRDPKFPELTIGFLLFAVVFLGGAGLFVYAGGTLAYGWITNRTDWVKITEEGIGSFGKFHRWDEIKWISCGCKRKGELTLFFQANGLGFDRYLPTTEPLTEVEIEALFRELRKDLSPRSKGLRIG